MSGLNHDALLAELSSNATLSRRGAFELDASKAREKMGKFQLQDPCAYVLEFMQASHLLGAAQVAIKADSDEFALSFTGAVALEPERLEALYSAAFSGLEDALTQALKHLAIGANAAHALGLKIFSIEAISAKNEAFIWKQIGEFERLERLDDVEPGREPGFVRIYLKERFRLSHFGEFLSRLSRDVAEVALLKARCRYSSQAIVINGEALDRGMALDEGCAAEREVEVKGGRALIGVFEQSGPLKLEVMQHGVLIGDSLSLDSVIRAHVVVESSALNKDLSRTAIVEDETWRELVDGVLPEQVQRLASDHIEARLKLSKHGARRVALIESERWAREILIERLGWAMKGLKGDRALYHLACRLPILQLAHQHWSVKSDESGEPKPISIYELSYLMERCGQRVVAYSDQRHWDVRHDERVILWFDPTQEPVEARHRDPLYRLHAQGGAGVAAAALVKELTHERGTLVRLKRRQKNEQLWLARPVQTSLFESDAEVSHVTRFGEATIMWEGRSKSNNPTLQVSCFKAQRLLSAWNATKHPVLQRMWLTIDAPFTENELFSDVEQDAYYTSVIIAAVSEFTRFMEKMACSSALEGGTQREREARSQHMLSYLDKLSSGLLSGELIDLLHASSKRMLRRQIGQKVRGHDWDVISESASLAPSMKLDARASKLSIADVPLFSTIDLSQLTESRASLRDLAAMEKRQGAIGYVLRSALDRVGVLLIDSKDEYLYLSLAQKEQLSSIVTPFLLRNMKAELERQMHRAALLKRATIEPGSFASTLMPVDVTTKYGMKVHMALLSKSEGEGEVLGGQALMIAFLFEQRVVEREALSELLPARARARVEVDEAMMRSDFSGVRRNKSFKEVVSYAEARALELISERFDDLFARLEALSEPELHELWSYLAFERQHGRSGTAKVKERQASWSEALVFERIEGERVNSEALGGLIDFRGRLFYVFEGEEVHAPLLPQQAIAVLVVPSRRFIALLEQLIGDATLEHVAWTDASRQVLDRRKQAFFANETLPLTEAPRLKDVSGRPLWERPLEVEGQQGAVAMWLDKAPKTSTPGLRIELLHHQRVAQTATRLCRLGQFTARLDATHLEMDPSWERLVNTAQLHRLCGQVAEQSYLYTEQRLEAYTRHPGQVGAEERLMWLGYMTRSSAEGLSRTMREASIAQLLEHLPLFETAHGEWLSREQVRAVCSEQSNALYYIGTDQRPPEEGERWVIWCVAASERELWRELFEGLLFIDLVSFLARMNPKKREQSAGKTKSAPSKQTATPSTTTRTRRGGEPEQALQVTLGADGSVEVSLRRGDRDIEAPKREVSRRLDPGPTEPKRREPAGEVTFEERVRDELRARMLAHRDARHNELRVQDAIVGRLDFASNASKQAVVVRGDGVVIDLNHAAMERLREDFEDQVWWGALESSVYSAINAHYREVTDEHEVHFLSSLIRALD